MNGENNYSMQILLDFHNQFTELYNQRQKIYIKILAIVVIVFSAYGIVLEKTLNVKDANFYDPKLLPIVTIFACLVMTYLNWILIHQGWSIRKNQWIINRIRESIITQDTKNKIFENYGAKKIELPDFYAINIIFSEILKFSITTITVVVGNASICCWLTATVIITVISIFSELLFYQNTSPQKT